MSQAGNVHSVAMVRVPARDSARRTDPLRYGLLPIGHADPIPGDCAYHAGPYDVIQAKCRVVNVPSDNIVVGSKPHKQGTGKQQETRNENVRAEGPSLSTTVL